MSGSAQRGWEVRVSSSCTHGYKNPKASPEDLSCPFTPAPLPTHTRESGSLTLGTKGVLDTGRPWVGDPHPRTLVQLLLPAEARNQHNLRLGPGPSEPHSRAGAGGGLSVRGRLGASAAPPPPGNIQHRHTQVYFIEFSCRQVNLFKHSIKGWVLRDRASSHRSGASSAWWRTWVSCHDHLVVATAFLPKF